MTEAFDAVLAETRKIQTIHDFHLDRLAAAHAAEVEAAERDARRWQAMREHMVAVDWKPEMGGGPVVMFECLAERIMAGPEGADAIADAAIEFAAIDACMGEKGNG